MNSRIVHPGIILKQSFLEPLKITAYRLAKETKISQTRISEIIQGKRAISIDTGLRLSKFFRLDDSFWLQAQMIYDIQKAKEKLEEKIEKIRPYDA